MSSPRVQAAAALLLAVFMMVVYAARLGEAPAYLTHDEVNFSLQGVAIADTGRDLNGRWFPVYFSEPEFLAGRDPMVIYAIALALQALPLSDATVRLPTVVVSMVTVLLVIVFCARVSRRHLWPILAGALLALSPGLFIHSRLAVSVIYPLPFVLAWLIAIHEYETRPRPWLLAAGGFALGAATYAYLAALVMLPVYVALTVWWLRAWRSPRVMLWLAAGLAIALLPSLLWSIAHPERYGELLQAYRVGDPVHAPVPPLLSWAGWRARIGAWWQYFNPDFMFISGDTSMTNSTRQAGFFPMAFAVLLPLGAWRLARGSRVERVLLAGLLTGPLAAVANGTIDLNRYRAMFVLPFGAIVAAYGAAVLWHSPRRWPRLVVAALVVGIAVQFASFRTDYLERYRDASSVWFGRNLRGALAVVYASGRPAGAVLVSERIPYAQAYERFYSRMFTGKAETAVPVNGSRLDDPALATAAWLIVDAAEPWRSSLASDWHLSATISEPSGEASFAVYRRQ
ncbi:MAG: hypothetical protein ACKOEC_06645 [Acidimicrobiia bacterium]